MDATTLEAEQASIEEDILKLQLHSVPLNLSWGGTQEEDEEEFDEETFLLSSIEDPDQPSTSGLNTGAGVRGPVVRHQPEIDSDEDEPVDQEEELIDLSADLEANPQNILKLNIAYQEVIQQQLQMVEELIHHNKCKQVELEAELNEACSESGMSSKPRADLGLRMSPFFKANTINPQITNTAPMPLHADVIRRCQELGEHFIENPMPPIKWKKEEEKKLVAGVQRVALRQLTEPLLSKLEYLEEKYSRSDDPDLKKKIVDVRQQIMNAKATRSTILLGKRDDEHDWATISIVDLGGLKSATGCELYWKNYLHPSINKHPWTKQEDANLKKIVKKFRESDWKSIAAELGTNRTALQCLQRYQKDNTDHKKKPWTPEEDEKLKNLVQKFRVANTIPYTLIALKMGNRNSNQVCHRWTKSVDPTYSRTKWTPAEDIALLKAIAKYGPRWAVIRDSGLVPGRNDAQCRERWDNTLRNINRGPWTKDEDKTISSLISEHGEGQWSMIARALDRRTDNQVYHRWRYIKKCREEGCAIEYKKKGPKTIVDSLADVRQKLIDTIEKQFQDTKKNEERKALPQLTFDTSLDETLKAGKEPPAKLPHRQVIRFNEFRHLKKWRWVDKDIEKRLKEAKNPDEMIELYHQLSEKVESEKTPKFYSTWSRSDKLINDKVYATISAKYKPYKQIALQDGTNIHTIREKVISTLKLISPKVLFIHYVKAMNINAEKTLQAIKHKDTQSNASEGTAESGEAVDDNAKEKNSQASGNQVPFVRNHFLPLCAPNRATVSAFRHLMQDRDRRVRNAKIILIDKNKTKSAKSKEQSPKVATIRSGQESESALSSHPFVYKGEKHRPEDLMKNVQLMPEHRILRSRFVSLFAWPTVLSTLVPYERSGSFRQLKPAVKIKRKPSKKEEEKDGDYLAAKRQKLSTT